MDQKTALELFEYRDGELYWRVKKSKKTMVGARAGFYNQAYGQIRVDGRAQYIHRIVYAMFFGATDLEIDHIDGDKYNNRIENLRAATRKQNSVNIRTPRRNTSGHKNVSLHAKSGKWQVRLIADGKPMFFGLFDDLELAALVASEARDKHHKTFARHV